MCFFSWTLQEKLQGLHAKMPEKSSVKEKVLFQSTVARGPFFFLHCLCIAQITGEHGPEYSTSPGENCFLLNTQDAPIHTFLLVLMITKHKGQRLCNFIQRGPLFCSKVMNQRLRYLRANNLQGMLWAWSPIGIKGAFSSPSVRS